MPRSTSRSSFWERAVTAAAAADPNGTALFWVATSAADERAAAEAAAPPPAPTAPATRAERARSRWATAAEPARQPRRA